MYAFDFVFSTLCYLTIPRCKTAKMIEFVILMLDMYSTSTTFLDMSVSLIESICIIANEEIPLG